MAKKALHPHLTALVLLALTQLLTSTRLHAQPSLAHDLSLRTSAWLHVLEKQQGYSACVLFAENQAPGAYKMAVSPDSLPPLPGLRLYRVRLQAGTWVHADGSANTLVCKHTGPMDDLHLVTAYDPEGQLRILSGPLQPDSARTWAPEDLPLAGHALVRLSYLQPRQLQTRRRTPAQSVFSAYSELLAKRVEIRLVEGSPDVYEIWRLGWRKVLLFRTGGGA